MHAHLHRLHHVTLTSQGYSSHISSDPAAANSSVSASPARLLASQQNELHYLQSTMNSRFSRIDSQSILPMFSFCSLVSVTTTHTIPISSCNT